MQLDLTDEEAAALLSLLSRAIADDLYPLSPRIRFLRAIRAKLRVRHPSRSRRDRGHPKNVRQGARRALVDRGVRGPDDRRHSWSVAIHCNRDNHIIFIGNLRNLLAVKRNIESVFGAQPWALTTHHRR